MADPPRMNPGAIAEVQATGELDDPRLIEAGISREELRRLGNIGAVCLFVTVVIVLLLARSNRALQQQIKERRITEERLAQQRAEYETMIDAVPALVLFKDDQNRCLRINPAGAELLGMRREDIEGRHVRELDPEHAEQFYRDDLKVIRSGRPIFGRTEVICAAGRGERWVRTDRIPYRDATGRVTGVIVFSVDITERLLAERALQRAHSELEARIDKRTSALKAEILQRRAAEEEACRARAEAENANRAKGQFLAAMSHEIRTPMNAIIGMTDLLLDTPLNPTQREFAETVRLSAEGLLTIINDVLDFSRIEAGRLQIDECDFSLREVIEGVVGMLGAAAAAKHIELVCSIAADIPDRLRGDPGRLRQVLLNLAANAVKFTPRGDVVVTVTRVKLETTSASVSPDRVDLHVTVRDTGPGISEQVQQQLFQPFVQGDGSTTRQFGGTGLGLAISRRLVEMLGGQIGLESSIGKGSTFWFTVPFLVASEHGNPDPNPARFAGKRVLIVDDNQANRTLLYEQLTSWATPDVAEVSNGPDALVSLRRAAETGRPFDVAVIDMEMPGLDGLTLARAIRNDSAFAHTVLILLTAHGRPLSYDEMRSAGIAACLAKPIRQSQLRRTLEEAITGVSTSEPTDGSAEPSSTLVESDGARSEKGATTPAFRSGEACRLLRILVAEDNPVNQRLTRHQLGKLGFRSEIVANGLEVLNAVQRASYDVVLMDCHMPELDGYEASRRLRELGHAQDRLIIIAMTANAMQGDREKCLASGMDDYLSKPTSVEKLRHALEAAAERLARRQAARGQ